MLASSSVWASPQPILLQNRVIESFMKPRLNVGLPPAPPPSLTPPPPPRVTHSKIQFQRSSSRWLKARFFSIDSVCYFSSTFLLVQLFRLDLLVCLDFNLFCDRLMGLGTHVVNTKLEDFTILYIWLIRVRRFYIWHNCKINSLVSNLIEWLYRWRI